MSGAEAYRQHVSEGEGSDSTAMQAASRMLKTGCKVAARVKELRERINHFALEVFDLEKTEALSYLQEVLRAPIDAVDESSVLRQESTVDYLESEEEGMIVRRRVKMPGKIEAIKQLDAMCGWNAPQRSPLMRAVR